MTKYFSAVIIMLLIGINAFGQVKIPADSLKKHVYYLADDSLEGRGLNTKSGLKAANYIADYFKQIGIKTVGGSYLHPFNTRQYQTMLTGNNVVGIIEGSDPELKKEYIVLGAHFDHISFEIENGEKIIYNGADDNASGTAAIIEIGRALVQYKDKFKRSIILTAFDGEESGLIGSGKFIEQKIVPVENIKLMMSIDMIGRFTKSNSLIVGAMGSLIGGEQLLFEIAKKHDIKIKKTGKKVSNRTDSKPFGDAGIPALYVSTGIIGPYHKPEDDPETIDYEGMGEISSLLFELTVKIANTTSLKPIRKLSAQAKRKSLPFFRYGIKANIGTSYHSYTNEFYNGKKKFSSEIGLITQLNISKNLSLQPEVLYSTIASDYNTGNFRTHSISIPVSLVLASKMNYGGRFYVNLGAYYSYHINGTANGESLDFVNTYNNTETGLVIGLGFELNSFIVGLNFKRGLSNMVKEENINGFKNRAFYLSIGYLF